MAWTELNGETVITNMQNKPDMKVFSFYPNGSMDIDKIGRQQSFLHESGPRKSLIQALCVCSPTLVTH